jgi:hypothetical protein
MRMVGLQMKERVAYGGTLATAESTGQPGPPGEPHEALAGAPAGRDGAVLADTIPTA